MRTVDKKSAGYITDVGLRLEGKEGKRTDKTAAFLR